MPSVLHCTTIERLVYMLSLVAYVEKIHIQPLAYKDDAGKISSQEEHCLNLDRWIILIRASSRGSEIMFGRSWIIILRTKQTEIVNRAFIDGFDQNPR